MNKKLSRSRRRSKSSANDHGESGRARLVSDIVNRSSKSTTVGEKYNKRL